MFEFIIEVIMQSEYLMLGVILLIIAVIISLLNGLLDIAFYVAILGGIILFGMGIVNLLVPDLLPIIVTGLLN